MASIEVVDINGWTAFEEITVHAAFNEAARSFRATIAAELGASTVNAIFKPGTAVTVSTNGEVLCTGFVNTKDPHLEPHDAWIEIGGRSKSQDLIDGAAEHDTGYFENKDPLEIAQAISSNYEAKWESDQQLEKLDQYKVQQGETCFRCVEKMVRDQGFTITGTKEGNAKITKPSGQRQGGSIIEGVNIHIGDAHQNDANRHSKITVRGQRPVGHDDQNLWIEAQETDSAVKRHRAIIIVQDNDTTQERAQKRAKNRKNRAAGNALKADITMQGFHDDTGQLWEPGNLVWTESPFLDIAQDMLIESVDYTQTNKGSFAKLHLVDPKAYDGQGAGGGKGSQSGDQWDMG
jgi:prophage tail gpP-like protein